VLSIHTPLTDLTRHIIDAEALAAMRPDAILVNTARGPIVDTAALGEALRTGQIRGAALDVTETEPLPADDPLLAIPQLTVTPHMAWYSEESYGELKRRTVENAADVAAGRSPRNIVNPEVLGAPGRNHELTSTTAR
jgi:D-3-phosphoglycerate dehydrogenase